MRDQTDKRREQVRVSLAKLRERRKAAGLCRECGVNPIDSNAYCFQCRLKHNARIRKRNREIYHGD